MPYPDEEEEDEYEYDEEEGEGEDGEDDEGEEGEEGEIGREAERSRTAYERAAAADAAVPGNGAPAPAAAAGSLNHVQLMVALNQNVLALSAAVNANTAAVGTGAAQQPAPRQPALQQPAAQQQMWAPAAGQKTFGSSRKVVMLAITRITLLSLDGAKPSAKLTEPPAHLHCSHPLSPATCTLALTSCNAMVAQLSCSMIESRRWS